MKMVLLKERAIILMEMVVILVIQESLNIIEMEDGFFTMRMETLIQNKIGIMVK